MRKPREHEFVCRCSAYRFPHRFGGGRCTGDWVAHEAWRETCGYSDPCRSCEQCDSENHGCSVTHGNESPETCDAWQEFVVNNDIRIYRVNWR